MIRQVQLKYFKRFEDQTFDLSDHVVLAGANNSGKTTLIQALNTWSLALRKWKSLKYRGTGNGNGSEGEASGSVKSRTGVPITRKELTSVPLRALDLLWTEASSTVLYVEGETDFDLLRAWAEVIKHPLSEWFDRNPFWYPIHGRSPREARSHFFALRSIRQDMRGHLLLDGDNRKLADREVSSEGLAIGRWRRYEAESYVVHPKALERFAQSRTESLFVVGGMKLLTDELPPGVVRDPTAEHDYLAQLPASKTLLPKFFNEVQLTMTKKDYDQIAAQMFPEELPAEVGEKLNEIARQFGVPA